MASWERFLGAMSWLQFRSNLVVNLALILLPNSHDFCYDRSTIGRRSWYWFSNDRRPINWENRRSNSTLKEPRSRFDRAAIVEFFHELSLPFDGNQVSRLMSIR